MREVNFLSVIGKIYTRHNHKMVQASGTYIRHQVSLVQFCYMDWHSLEEERIGINLVMLCDRISFFIRSHCEKV